MGRDFHIAPELLVFLLKAKAVPRVEKVKLAGGCPDGEM